MTVYADILFLINFAFDMEILLLVLKINSRPVPILRLLLSCACGGMQGVFAFVPYFRILSSPSARFITPIALTFLVMYPCDLSELVRGAVTFILSAFLFSGAITFFKIKTIFGLLMPVPVYFLLCFVKRKIKRKYLPTILEYSGKRVCINGFYDSGNSVSFNGIPVILADKSVFELLFGKGFSKESICEFTDAERVCAVPYKALGTSGIVMGIRLDSAIVNKKKYNKIILGYFSDSFSEKLILNGIMT